MGWDKHMVTKSKPSENDGKERNLYFPLTREVLQQVNTLNASELKIFLYIKTLDPKGYSSHELDMDDLKAVTGIKSMGTIYPALAELHRLGLIEWIVSKSYVRSVGNPKIKRINQDQDSDPTIGNPISGSEFRSEDQDSDPTIGNLKNPTPEPVQALESASLNDLNDLNDSNDLNREREASELEIDPDYRKWLEDKVDRLPQPAVFREEVIQEFAGRKSVQREYQRYKQRIAKRIEYSATADPVNFEQKPVAETPEQTIARNRAKWLAMPTARAGITEWALTQGIEVDDRGCPIVAAAED